MSSQFKPTKRRRNEIGRGRAGARVNLHGRPVRGGEVGVENDGEAQVFADVPIEKPTR